MSDARNAQADAPGRDHHRRRHACPRTCPLIATAAHAAAYREQFGISTDRSLIGERPDHGDGARAYDQITARVRDLHGATTPVAARTGDLVDRASMQQEQLRHDQQIAQERAEQGRLEETRRAERLEQIRRQQRDPKRKGPTLQSGGVPNMCSKRFVGVAA